MEKLQRFILTENYLVYDLQAAKTKYDYEFKPGYQPRRKITGMISDGTDTENFDLLLDEIVYDQPSMEDLIYEMYLKELLPVLQLTMRDGSVLYNNFSMDETAIKNENTGKLYMYGEVIKLDFNFADGINNVAERDEKNIWHLFMPKAQEENYQNSEETKGVA